MKLYIVIYFFTACFILKALYNWIRAVVMRISMYIKLRKICKDRGYEFKRTRFIFSSFFRFSRCPDIIISAAGTDYLVRIITCRARKRFYHFVSHEWFVRVMKAAVLLPFLSGDAVTLFKHAKYLPPLDEKFFAGHAPKQVILLFNPSPLEVTFTAHQSARQLASNATDFDGWKTYNAKGFADMLKELSGAGE